MAKVDLHSAFGHAINARHVGRDFVKPTLGVKSTKYVRRSRTSTDGELVAFLDWLPDSGLSRPIRDVPALMLLTGCPGGRA